MHLTRKCWLCALVLCIAVAMTVAPAMATSVTLTGRSTCDNDYELHVGGQTVLGDNNWKTAESWSVDLPYGQFVVAVKGWNAGNYSTGNPAAFLAELALPPEALFGDLGGQTLVTDGTWKYAVGVGSPDWTSPAFDDSGWQAAALYGTNGGSSIWRSVNGGPVAGVSTSANWIWSQVPADSPVYLRRVFTIVPAVSEPPVPEPITGVTLFAALAGLGRYVRRRVKA